MLEKDVGVRGLEEVVVTRQEMLHAAAQPEAAAPTAPAAASTAAIPAFQQWLQPRLTPLRLAVAAAERRQLARGMPEQTLTQRRGLQLLWLPRLLHLCCPLQL